MYSIVISQEQAEQEVNAFLDAKNIRPKKRESMAAIIEILIEAVSLGFLIIDAGTGLTQKLETPVVNGDYRCDEINWKWRITPEVLNNKISKLKDKAIDNQILAVGEAYTEMLAVNVNKMEAGDLSTYKSLCMVFFPQ